MASLWELMAAREDMQMSAMKEKQAQFAENQRQRDVQTKLREAVATRPEYTSFAPPQQQQPNTLVGLAPTLQSDPSLTEITGRQRQSPEQATYEFLRTNEPLSAPDYAAKVLKTAEGLAVGGDHAAAVDYVNKSLGTKIEYLGSKDDWMDLKNDDGTRILFNPITKEERQLGMPKKRDPISVAHGNTLIDPETYKPLYTAPDKEAADKFQLTEVPTADGKTAQKFRVNMTDGTMTPIGNPYAVKSQVPNVNVHTSGPVPVAQTTFVDPSSGNPLVFDKSTGTYRVATVQGSGVAPKPSAMSPEAAGKAQMLEQGMTYIPTLRAELFDADGSVNQINVANLAARTWGTRGRELSTLMLDAVEAKLRAESGAAVPEPEVKRAAKRFMPQIGDTANGIKIKLDNLENYLKGTTAKINNGRGPAKPPANNGNGKTKNAGYSDLLNKYRK